ncbi:MAG: hypothetical protein V3T24_10235 [Longimicrobiales bacterium]
MPRLRGELPDMTNLHKGMATWGERLVPLEDFRAATTRFGRTLSEEGRRSAVKKYLTPADDASPVEGPYGRIAVFGGVYNNHFGLEALLESGGARSIQGNYEESLAADRGDCNCGYSDPRDNHFAALSYGYTARRCSPEFKAYMGELPSRRRVAVGDRELLLVHGSPRQVNEFLFASTSSTPYLEVLCDENGCDGILCTHTGLHWHRRLPSGRDMVNVGVIGRPANDGRTNVWYAMLSANDDASADEGGSANGCGLDVELVPLEYDRESLAAEMRREKLPEEFVETTLSGWWTTCLEILPAKERAASRF